MASAPAHLPEATAWSGSSDVVPESLGVRGRLARNFALLSTAVAGVFAVTVGAGIISGCTNIGIVFLFWVAASVIGGLAYGAMHRPVSPILLLLVLSALTIS